MCSGKQDAAGKSRSEYSLARIPRRQKVCSLLSCGGACFSVGPPLFIRPVHLWSLCACHALLALRLAWCWREWHFGIWTGSFSEYVVLDMSFYILVHRCIVVCCYMCTRVVQPLTIHRRALLPRSFSSSNFKVLVESMLWCPLPCLHSHMLHRCLQCH